MDDPLVRVATAWSEPIAQSWAELLRNNGIPSIVKAAGPGFSLGAPLPFGFPIYLLVPASLFARGHAILEGYEEPGELELEPVGDAAG
ncbi:MAG TPA: hypothetical protein VFB34_01310 [Chloroflexota bacterium]|nr:hypothetical protein [Chloroflexota bacterium]